MAHKCITRIVMVGLGVRSYPSICPVPETNINARISRILMLLVGNTINKANNTRI